MVIDTLFDIRGNIRDCINISNGKLGPQNFSFSSIEKKEFPGGCGGNISYGLALLGQSTLMASIVGKDFAPKFKKYYEDLNINLRLHTDKDGYTATFYGMTDGNKEQIGVFQGNALTKHNEKIFLKDLVSNKEFASVGIAIVSAQSAKATIKKLEEIKKISGGRIFTIFDPGQELMHSFGNDPSSLIKAISLSNMMIANEVETIQTANILNIDKKDIFSLGTEYFIETLGENGSIVYTKNGSKEIPSVKVKKVIDPTGAGDAFRAGLIHGLISGKNIEESMEIGAVMGALCVQSLGGQAYLVPKKALK